MDPIHAQSTALAAHVRKSREQILAAWRERVDRDPELTTASSISRAQFTDSIPRVLDAFERALCADNALGKSQANREQRESASEHGLQRWQQGYDLRETMREWAHLHRCILAQLERYATEHPRLKPPVMQRAREALVRLCGEGACESAARYSRLQQAEAAGRMRDLEAAVEQLRALDRNRVDLLREAAHDLRGSVGVITNASAVLARTTAEETRFDFFKVLDRGIHSTHALLNDLIDLTRLEAGQDRIQVISYDASQQLREIGESLRAEATARGLFLKLEGPDSLAVRGDPIKLRRIVQNLVLNALKATAHGGVTISWQEPQPSEPRWVLSIQDTGPGMQGSHATPLTEALSEATDEAHAHEPQRVSAPGQAMPSPEGATPTRATPVNAPTTPGEGIGLSIVKRLCELLGIAIELESGPGQGTVFRLTVPTEVLVAPSH